MTLIKVWSEDFGWGWRRFVKHGYEDDYLKSGGEVRDSDSNRPRGKIGTDSGATNANPVVLGTPKPDSGKIIEKGMA
jgi:hypothetical protein